jgi:hypothetical protein
VSLRYLQVPLALPLVAAALDGDAAAVAAAAVAALAACVGLLLVAGADAVAGTLPVVQALSRKAMTASAAPGSRVPERI